MLEVAAGTGRLATFVRDNYPEAHLTVSDLSPFYLQQARETVAHWQELCGRARCAFRFLFFNLPGCTCFCATSVAGPHPFCMRW